MAKRAWDQKIRKICDLPNNISVWTVALYGYQRPDFRYERYGTCIGVFREENLESAITDYDNSINSDIYHMAMSEARRYAKEIRKPI